MTPTRATLIALAGVLILSPDAALIRLVGADLFVIMQWRGALAGLTILGGLCLAFGPRRVASSIRAAGRGGMIYAGLYAITGTLFVYAAATTTVANTLFILATAPAFAALFSRVLLNEPITRRAVLTMGGVALGLCLIALDAGTESAKPDWRGDVAALTAAATLGLGFTMLRRAGDVDLVPMVGLAGLAQSAVALMLIGPVLPPSGAMGPLLLMGVVVVPLAFVLITRAARYLPATDTSLIMLLEAVFGPLIVWAVFAEVPGPLALAGGVVVLFVMAWATLNRR